MTRSVKVRSHARAGERRGAYCEFMPATPDQPSDQVRAAWATWAPFSDPAPDLDAELEAALLHPSPTWDAFFHEVIHAFDETSDGHWIEYALRYASRATDRTQAIQDLEHVLDHPDRYLVLGGLYSAAASHLGRIAPYPNEALLRLMRRPDCGDEEMDAVLRFSRAAAFGAYVMTATTFDHGLNAGRQVMASGRRPTRQDADALVRAWQVQQEAESPEEAP